MPSPTRTASARPRSSLQGLTAAERARLPGRLALRVRHQQGLPLRQDRGQSRQAPGAGRPDRRRSICRTTMQHNWKFVAFGPDGQALRAGRLELQHLRDQSRHPRPDPPLQRRRHRHGDRGARRAQHGRLRLASGDQGAVVHRQRPRLGRRRRTGGRAQPRRQGPGRRDLRLPLLPRQGHPRSGRQAAESLRRRHHAGRADRARTPPRSASSSTPASMFPQEYKNVAFIARHGSWNREQEVRLRRGGGAGSPAARPRSSRS